MASITRWHIYGRWALAVVGLVGSVTAVAAQEGRWERVTAAGAQAFAQGDYPRRPGTSGRRSPWRMPAAWHPVS